MSEVTKQPEAIVNLHQHHPLVRQFVRVGLSWLLRAAVLVVAAVDPAHHRQVGGAHRAAHGHRQAVLRLVYVVRLRLVSLVRRELLGHGVDRRWPVGDEGGLLPAAGGGEGHRLEDAGAALDRPDGDAARARDLGHRDRELPVGGGRREEEGRRTEDGGGRRGHGVFQVSQPFSAARALLLVSSPPA